MPSPTPILTIIFDAPFAPGGLRYFRGAMQQAATAMGGQGLLNAEQASLFHNHGEEEGCVITRYPLIQYQVISRRAAVTAIGEGAVALNTFMLYRPDELRTKGGTINLENPEHRPSPWQPALGEPRQYVLNKWLPLNPDRYRKWQATGSLAERVKLLDGALWGNIFELAEAVGYTIPREDLVLHTTSIDLKTYKKCYEQNLLALDVVITTNLNLPDEVGLGHGKSIGFGKVRRLPEQKK